MTFWIGRVAGGGSGFSIQRNRRGMPMTMYVYSTEGSPVGFVFGMTIYDLEGAPLGRILGSRVHRFDGAYVGEWFKDMVVSRPTGRPRTIPAVAVPPRRAPAHPTCHLRAVVNYGYRDMFHALAPMQGHEEKAA